MFGRDHVIAATGRHRAAALALTTAMLITACSSNEVLTPIPSGPTPNTTGTTTSDTTPIASTTDPTTTASPTSEPNTADGTTTSEPPPQATTTVVDAFPDAVPIIVDSDANNELDDQHALAAALLRPDRFDLRAITTNATVNGGSVDAHSAEARRIAALTGRDGEVPVVTGADGSFDEIRPTLGQDGHDGEAAVDTIIATARAEPDLVVVPIGKLTNVALAVAKAPDIADGLRVLWLGSNHPLGSNEYNLDNDPDALAYLLADGIDAGLDIEIAVVRPGDTTGTDAVRLTLDEAARRLPGLGPEVDPAVVGRDGASYDRFGDYAAGLFEAVEGFGDPPSRALYDLAAIAIVAEPAWGTPTEVAAPTFADGAFVDQPDRDATIVVWDRFDRDAIIADLFSTLAAADPASS